MTVKSKAGDMYDSTSVSVLAIANALTALSAPPVGSYPNCFSPATSIIESLK